MDLSYLWMSRADCEAWFRRYEIAFPKEWMLNSNRADLMHGSETPGKIPRYPLLERPTQPAPAYAYYVLLNRWGLEGPPRSLSIRQITGDANEHRLSLPETKIIVRPLVAFRRALFGGR